MGLGAKERVWFAHVPGGKSRQEQTTSSARRGALPMLVDVVRSVFGITFPALCSVDVGIR
jgi:hypothetical protein